MTPGAFTYTPDPDANGTDTITFQVSDGALSSNLATLTVTINPVNDAPVASDDSYTTDQDVELLVGGPGVLFNDSDADGNPMTASTLVSAPTHGALTLYPNGSFIYTPDAGFSGEDDDGTDGERLHTE